MQNETNKELLEAAQTLSNKLTALQEEWGDSQIWM